MSSTFNHADVPADSPGKSREVAHPILSAPPPGPGDPVPQTIDGLKTQIAELEHQIKVIHDDGELAHDKKKMLAIESVYLFNDVLNAGGEIPKRHFAKVTKMMDEIDEVDAKKAVNASNDPSSSEEDAAKKA